MKYINMNVEHMTSTDTTMNLTDVTSPCFMCSINLCNGTRYANKKYFRQNAMDPHHISVIVITTYNMKRYYDPNRQSLFFVYYVLWFETIIFIMILVIFAYSVCMLINKE
ncbi:hypothetical protein KSF78_0007839 [Schistosoma japonicum]|nr:hypothetical protein KSF78_0007839 [Schistosoma japonicum]